MVASLNLGLTEGWLRPSITGARRRYKGGQDVLLVARPRVKVSQARY